MNNYPGAPRRPQRRCPPHTPLTVVRTPGGRCVAECMGCGKRGPERETAGAARIAFLEAAEE